MGIIIKEGTEKDLPAVLELIKGLAIFEKQPHAVTNTVERMREDMDYFEFFTAVVNGETVGMSLYYYTYSTWVGKSLYLEDLYVEPEYRNNGIGSQLLKKTVDVAKRQNCHRMRWQVLDWNTEAQKLYEKVGAEISKEWYNCDLSRDGILKFK